MQKLSFRDKIKEARINASDSFRGGKLMSSIFRPGSPFSKNVDPKNTIREPINIMMPVTNKLEDRRDLIISRIRFHSSQIVNN